MQEYFKEVEEESIRDNFVICYELLDELVDFGYPQTTDAKILQEYITQVITSTKETLWNCIKHFLWGKCSPIRKHIVIIIVRTATPRYRLFLVTVMFKACIFGNVHTGIEFLSIFVFSSEICKLGPKLVILQGWLRNTDP